MGDISIDEARAAMIAKRFGGNVNGASSAGNGGTVRRKKKGPMKSIGDDKKLGGVLKKMALTPINGTEEVNIFKSDGEVIHITTPKIQASVPSNTFVISGNVETKQVTELLPGILNQLGPEAVQRLKDIYAASVGSQGNQAVEEEDDDDDVPELVENFEEAANK